MDHILHRKCFHDFPDVIWLLGRGFEGLPDGQIDLLDAQVTANDAVHSPVS